MPHIATSVAAIMMLASATAFAQQVALVPGTTDCPWQEPDSVQISWDQPCSDGDWLFDTETGCRMWDWHPDPHDRAVWSGACPNGVKDGTGVVQWYEHGQPIDRFEGTYRHGKREGFGRYEWHKGDRFEGSYVNDVPHGFGTAALAGETFKGEWNNGCFRKGGRVVAIGVPRSSCRGIPTTAREGGAAGS